MPSLADALVSTCHVWRSSEYSTAWLPGAADKMPWNVPSWITAEDWTRRAFTWRRTGWVNTAAVGALAFKKRTFARCSPLTRELAAGFNSRRTLVDSPAFNVPEPGFAPSQSLSGIADQLSA